MYFEQKYNSGIWLYNRSDVPTFIGASKDFATLTITGVKKTQKMSYMKSPACNLLHACIVKLKYHKQTKNFL